jgi:hypothetical protein
MIAAAERLVDGARKTFLLSRPLCSQVQHGRQSMSFVGGGDGMAALSMRGGGGTMATWIDNRRR